MLTLVLPVIVSVFWLKHIDSVVNESLARFKITTKQINSKHTTQSASRKTYLDHNGYWRFKDSDILVHRYVAQKQVGRRLKNGEVVHHVDGNKWNNNSNNLHVCTQEEHHNIHLENLRVSGNWYGY